MTAGSGAFDITARATSMVLERFRLRHLEDQFVMHLQQHPALQTGLGKRRRHADHGPADDVGGRTLDGRIDGGALLEGALGRIGRLDPREMHAPAEDGFDIAIGAAERLGALHVVADAGETLEIGLDVLACLLARDRQLVGETERRDAVDDAEIDRLGAAAHGRVHALDRHVEHFRRGHGVNVQPVGERLSQLRNVGHMGQYAKFDLAVVGRHQLVARCRHEGGADLAAFRRAHRNVLQVRIGRGETSGRRGSQRIGRVHPARFRVDVAGQRVRVGRAQLGQLAPVEQLAGKLHALARQLFQHLAVG